MSKLRDDPCHRLDKLGLFVLAGLVVIVLGGVVLGTFMTEAVPEKGDVLLGGLVTGLILFLRDLVNAVRAGWEEVTKSETNKQLANASPGNETKDVNIVGQEKTIEVKETE